MWSFWKHSVSHDKSLKFFNRIRKLPSDLHDGIFCNKQLKYSVLSGVMLSKSYWWMGEYLSCMTKEFTLVFKSLSKRRLVWKLCTYMYTHTFPGEDTHQIVNHSYCWCEESSEGFIFYMCVFFVFVFCFFLILKTVYIYIYIYIAYKDIYSLKMGVFIFRI